MTFNERDHGWHWEYTGPYARSEGKKIWRFWLAAILFIYSILGLVLLLDESSRSDSRAVILTILSLGVCITIPFVILWLQNRYGKQGCSFTANNRAYGPFSSLPAAGSKNRGFLYRNIKTLTQCRERDAIIANLAGTLSCSVYADAGDYQEVWDFFVEHCPNAEITAPITGQQYDEFYEIERDQEQE